MVKKKIMPFGICSFISLSFVLSFSPVLADSAYTLVETTSDDKSENVIVKYEYDNNTGLLTPKYYRVNLNKTEYGNSNGNQTLSFDSKYSATGKIDYKYNSIDTTGTSNEKLENGNSLTSTPDGNYFNLQQTTSENLIQGGAINNSGNIGSIRNNFSNNGVKIDATSGDSLYSMGGAVYNAQNTQIENIQGDFISNYAEIRANGSQSDSYAQGGAVYNDGIINNINSDFIENHVQADGDTFQEVNAMGGAVYNTGSIDEISGDFISNYANSSVNLIATYTYGAANAFGGAIYNDFNSAISIINSDFINNGVQVNADANFWGSNAFGGAIYNNGQIGNINGDFISNYARLNNLGDAVGGGGIYNAQANISNLAGNFIENYAEAINPDNSYIQASGGAIYNWVSDIESLTGDFISNYAYANGQTASADGGAIYNKNSHIESLTGDFISNYAYAESLHANAAGGAISQFESPRTIVDIQGDFIKNYAVAISKGNKENDYLYNNQEYATAYGGAIGNHNSNIRTIRGNFIENFVLAESDTDSKSYGGAFARMYDDGWDAGPLDFTGNFINNSAEAKGNNAISYGGAVYNQVNMSNLDYDTADYSVYTVKIDKIDGTTKYFSIIEELETEKFISYDEFKNKINKGIIAVFDTSDETISEAEVIDELKEYGFNSIEEYLSTVYELEGMSGTFEDVKEYYDNNNYIPKSILTFTNSSFVNNSAKAEGESADAKGGAIYTTSDIKIEANNGYHSLISGNYTEVNGIKDENAIYMASVANQTDYESSDTQEIITMEYIPSSLVLDANTNGIIQIDDKINGEKAKTTQIINTYDENTGTVITEETILSENKDQSYKIYITGDSTGTVILNNDVEGEADMYLYQTTLKLGKRDDVLKNNNMTFNSGTFDMVNNNIGSTNFNTLTLNDNIKTKADVDLINETMDRITSDNYIINENKLNDKLISVDYLNLLNDSTKDSVKILYADEEISSNVEYIGSNPIQVDEDKIAYSPIYKYTVSYDIDENDNMGYFTFNRGNINDSNSYNPSVLAPSVSSQAGAYTTQLQTLEYAFKHSDAFMALPSFERMAIINADRYALTPTSDATDIGTFSPLMTKLDVSGFWVKPYTSFESIPLNNGPKVSNISYGTLVGYDSNLKHLKNGWERVLTGYIGYNGASQRYSGIDTYQNGGILGLTTTFYKNNFFNATTISTGAAVGDSSTYYGDEDYTMLTAGIGNKFGYNFEFKDGKFILQPNLLLSYTFINTFDYTNAAGLKIKSDPLHALQIAPGIKFIMNTESGWQPYLRADMIWNILDKTKVTANDVRLPEMSIDPYVQYGIGVQKLFKNERLTFFGQALVQNGGRNGVSLNAGLRWAIGKGTN